jgi:serine/threonine-protein kinase HipA
MNLKVFLNAYGRRRFAGILSDRNGIAFEYDAAFLKEGIEISPLMLPLRPGVFRDKKGTFDGLYGVFNDSIPDGWGRLLTDRHLQKRGLSPESITPLHRLSVAGTRAMGALEYEPPEEPSEKIPRIILDDLAARSEKILEGESEIALEKLRALNGSSGGARPKIVALVSADKKRVLHGTRAAKGLEPWLIKFSCAFDGRHSGAVEYLYSLMARKAGIEMPETHLFPSKITPGHFGAKRFDRLAGQKIHVHSACGLLHADPRQSTLDYEGLVRLTALLTQDIRETARMVRLMIFNVKAGNRDDHSRNFSFLMDPLGEWKLSPAYDLTPSVGVNGEQTAMVNGKGRGITNNDLLAVAAKAGLPEKEAREMIGQVEDALSEYPAHCRRFGLKMPLPGVRCGRH